MISLKRLTIECLLRIRTWLKTVDAPGNLLVELSGSWAGLPLPHQRPFFIYYGSCVARSEVLDLISLRLRKLPSKIIERSDITCLVCHSSLGGGVLVEYPVR